MKTKAVLKPLCLIIIIFLMAGCASYTRTPPRNEAALKEDLLTMNLPLSEGGIITDLSIIKRLTDEEARIDEVYVSVGIEYDTATEMRSYLMHYTRYNDGWHFDNAEAYYEADSTWDLIPNYEPSGELILQEIKEQEEAYSSALNIPSTMCFCNEMGYTAQIEADEVFFSQSTLSVFCNYRVVIDYATKYGYSMTSTYNLCFEFSNYTKEWELYSFEPVDYQSIPFEPPEDYFDILHSLTGKADINFISSTK